MGRTKDDEPLHNPRERGKRDPTADGIGWKRPDRRQPVCKCGVDKASNKKGRQHCSLKLPRNIIMVLYVTIKLCKHERRGSNSSRQEWRQTAPY